MYYYTIGLKVLGSIPLFFKYLRIALSETPSFLPIAEYDVSLMPAMMTSISGHSIFNSIYFKLRVREYVK